MKKIKLLITAGLLLLSGCSNTQKEQQNLEDSLYLLYATPLSEHPIWLQSKEGFYEACDEIHAVCDWIGPSVIDTEKMEEVILQGILQKADGIITQGVISEELMKMAYEADISVILVDSNMPDAPKLAYYGKNFKEQAELFLEAVESDLGADAALKIGIQVAELSFDIAKDQIREIEEVFAQHHGSVEIVAVTESKSDKIRAQQQWMDTLRIHPEINVAINFAAESAEAIAEITKTMKMEHEFHIYCVDDMEETLQYIREGIIDASIVTSFYEYGYDTVYQIYDYKKNKRLPETVDNDVKLRIVNLQNVDTYKEELEK